ncbi:MAG TPA: hypothetical protein PLD25_24250 [Chloroflexota bacterium]|nr:hypothetical protein [Chloroflexota bacterium]HUM71474.1 hypothetical protein [Chloroflexota bacterium]
MAATIYALHYTQASPATQEICLAGFWQHCDIRYWALVIGPLSLVIGKGRVTNDQ